MNDACTIVARNYLPYARVFAQTLRSVHPSVRITVLLIDADADPSDAALFRTMRFEDVQPDARERQRLAFMYDVTELSTAVKPLLLSRLLAEGADSVLYFDPDIQVFDSVQSLWDHGREHGIVLTPHVLSPIPDDGLGVSDLFVLRAGVYNLGFIGVGRGAGPFLDWWWGRLRRHCIAAPDKGLFVDQRWVDYVPSLFSHFIVRDPGCNVAYWNLHERRIGTDSRGFTVNDTPLRFFHFSGFDPAEPHLLSRHQGDRPRILMSEAPALREICGDYVQRLQSCGRQSELGPYTYSQLPDGTTIDPVMRACYRQALVKAELGGHAPPPVPDEGDVAAWLNEPAPEAPRVSRYLYTAHEMRLDLQRVFPGPHGAAADAYLHWARGDPLAARAIPPALRTFGTEPAAEAPVAGPRGLNIVGYFGAEGGVGEVARRIAAAARAHAIPTMTILNDRTPSCQNETFELHHTATSFATTLLCVNADELPRALDALPRVVSDGRYRIGFWFWETEELPPEYREAAALVDEVWTASEFVAEAVRKTVAKPVYVCPVPARTPDPAPLSRAEMGLPDRFLFLFMFDFLSVVQRKNPLGLIRAFRQAFRPGEGPVLVLKSVNGDKKRADLEAVRGAVRDRPDVLLIDRHLDAGARDALLAGSDCYVSLHRSEGLGLTLMEAMALGKPTIGTGYSGNLSFMTHQNSFLVPWRPTLVPPGCTPYPSGHRWAEPDVTAAAILMRTVHDFPERARERGRRAAEDISALRSPARAAAFFEERLADIAGRQRPARALRAMVATPSRFAWPVQVLRTAVSRLIRPLLDRGLRDGPV